MVALTVNTYQGPAGLKLLGLQRGTIFAVHMLSAYGTDTSLREKMQKDTKGALS